MKENNYDCAKVFQIAYQSHIAALTVPAVGITDLQWE